MNFKGYSEESLKWVENGDEIVAIIYFLTGLIATMFGSMAGLGGGIIIKPVLDFLGDYDVESIAVLSASTVFAMACVSLITSAKSDVKINVKSSLTIAIGSIIGGLVGKLSFGYIIDMFENAGKVTVIQSLMIAVLMCFIYVFVRYKHKMKTYNMNNIFIIVGIGFILGVLAAFLGIGGGPFNVAILALCFSMNAKESALNSIFIIFFSQLSALMLLMFTTGFGSLDLSMLLYMLPGGVLGGFVGSKIAKSIDGWLVEKIFAVGIILIIVISVWNVVNYYI